MTKQVITINANVQWRTCQGPSGRWVGECKPLGLAVEGDTIDEVYSLIDESTGLLFADLIGDNEFDQFLRDKGWTRGNHDVFVGEDVEVDLPYELVVEGRHRGQEQRPC